MRKIEIELQDSICYRKDNFDCPCLSFKDSESGRAVCEKYDVTITTKGTLVYQACEQCIKDSKGI